jgi:hypothetical protein
MTYGPVDFLALEFKTDQLKGEVLPELLDLVQKEIVRLIDLAIFDPLDIEISGIIQMEDVEVIAEAMEPNTTAALLLFENLWAIKFGEAVVRSSGRMLMFDRIPFEVVNETLEIFAQEES